MTWEEITQMAYEASVEGTDYPDWLAALFEHKTILQHTQPRWNYYRFLRRLVKKLRPRVVLELGVEYGLASAMMASVDKDIHVIGVDLKRHELPAHRIVSKCLNYHYIVGNSLRTITYQTVEGIAAIYGPIGLVFQDSSHHYDASREEWRLYSPLLADQALWICDDITPAFHDPNIDPPNKGMVQYWDELPGDKRLFPDILHKGNTIGVMIYDGI